MIFKRKIYGELVKWKKESNGKPALLLEGARRVEKSAIVEEFAKKEYRSYIKIDFSDTKNFFTKDMKDAFEKTKGYSKFLMALQMLTKTESHERASAIIFDEAERYAQAKEMIKRLFAEARHDFIKTGSLINLEKHSRKTIIPSEEHRLEMHPMSFDEWLLALGGG